MAEEGMTKKAVVLANPFSLDDEQQEAQGPNLIRRILSLFKNVRPGSDLTNFQLPPHFNIPKSQLQCYGESVYSFGGEDLLAECNRRDKPIERLKSVVTWNIAALRPVIFGMAPYNPILGETHHVSRGDIHVLLEQVSHHPPVTALHATHEKENVEMIWCNHHTPKFRGAYVEVEVKGKRTLKLRNRGETYEMNAPNLLIRFMPVSAAYWTGKVKIKCLENGLTAELDIAGDSLMGIRGNNRSIKGKIYESSSGKKLYSLHGYWDKTVTAKDVKTGTFEIIYNAKENLTGLKSLTVKDLKEVEESESGVVWSKLSEAIMEKEWERARVEKTRVEGRQRETLREREASGNSWSPRHFRLTHNGKDWDCSPLSHTVPPAPILAPSE